MNNFLHISFFSVSVTVLSGIAILASTGVALKTGDESKYLQQYSLSSDPLKNGNVLGVSTNNTGEQNLSCPKNKPVIGYINFKGQRLIKNTLKAGQTAGACFEDVQAANRDSFFYPN